MNIKDIKTKFYSPPPKYKKSIEAIHQLTEMKVNYKKLNSNEWKKTEKLSLKDKNVTDIRFLEGIKMFDCSDNLIEDVILPESMRLFKIKKNKLKDIKINDGLLLLKCYTNLLKRLNVVTSLENLECDNVKVFNHSQPQNTLIKFIC